MYNAEGYNRAIDALEHYKVRTPELVMTFLLKSLAFLITNTNYLPYITGNDVWPIVMFELQTWTQSLDHNLGLLPSWPL